MDNGIYFEDLPIGLEAISPARTLTEADIVNFCGLSGDFNVIHTDVETAKEGPFGQRIAHGLLGLSIASGLVARNPGAEQHKLVAFLGMTWDFKRPIFIGDTVHVIQTVREKHDTRKPGMGVIIFDAKVINQVGKVCQVGEWKVMYARRVENGDEDGEA
ncbi:MAG: MaoC family dehydratase N-terminal domain-containing protein [Candidatus Hydrogenedentes bacterium]|nr:MaoC family dehydratase N-terminal domain-containing protein [Candidatus Hydrogenedentota bacterium]